MFRICDIHNNYYFRLITDSKKKIFYPRSIRSRHVSADDEIMAIKLGNDIHTCAKN